MHPSTLILTSLLAALTTAAPAKPQQDKCGPTNPKFLTPDNPKDTCAATPPASASPATFGVTVITGASVDWNSCAPSINYFCERALAENSGQNPILEMDVVKPNAWKFYNYIMNGGICQYGIYIPGDPVVAGAAPRPSVQQCKRVFGGMMSVGGKTADALTATLNLVVNPTGQEGQALSVDGASGTGSPVNEGFASFYMQVGGSMQE